MKPHYPWPHYRHSWLSDVDVTVDGATFEHPDLELRRVRLDEVEGWSMAELAITVSTTEVPVEGLAVETCFAVLSCPQTNTRDTVELMRDGNTSSYSGTLSLTAELLRGSATLQLGGVDGRSRAISRAEDWTIIADLGAAPPRPGSPPFDSKWVDFTSTDAPAAARRALAHDPKCVATLDVSTSGKPVLYLNDSVPGMKKIIEAQAPKQERRRQQLVLGTSIARDAARAYFMAALDASGFTATGEFQPSDVPGHTQILEAVAGVLGGKDSVGDLAADLRGENASDDQRSEAWRDVEAALNRLVGASGAIRTALKEVS